MQAVCNDESTERTGEMGFRETVDTLPSAATPELIAAALDSVQRYAGRTAWMTPRVCYSNARHSLLASKLCPDRDIPLRMAVLMHDAHEIWTGDVQGPVKRKLIDNSLFAPLQIITNEIDGKIRAALGLAISPDVLASVEHFDRNATTLELEYLGKPTQCVPFDAFPEIRFQLVANEPAEQEWLDEFYFLKAQMGG